MPDESAGATFTIPNEADILVAYSTYEGRVAYRDMDEGTWYISELCKEIDKSARSDDLLTMLTRVNRQVALTKENFEEKQMPSLQSTLTRKIYFYADDRQKQTVSISSLQEVHAKLDRLLNAWEGGLASPSTLPISDTILDSERKLQGGGWDSLRVWSGTSEQTGTLPLGETVLRHAKALKLFLKDKDVDDDVYENGKTILSLLSCWDTLDVRTKAYAHTRALTFLKKHAQDWPVLEVLDLGSPGLQNDGTPGTRSRKSSRSSSQSVATTSYLPRPRPPFK